MRTPVFNPQRQPERPRTRRQTRHNLTVAARLAVILYYAARLTMAIITGTW